MLFRLLASSAVAVLLGTSAFAQERVLDVVSPFELKGPEPGVSGYIYLQMDIIETLVNSDLEGNLVPGLATEWTTSEDGLEWRFLLRDGVTFHDGTPLDAAAAAHALSVAQGKPGLLATAPITRIEGQGNEVVFHLAEPFEPLAAFLTEYRNMIYAPAAYAVDGAITEVIGTGAYKITKIEAPLRMEVERFEGYWGEPAHIANATYQSVGRAETRALMAESGEAEYVVNLDPASVARLAELDGLDVYSVSIPRAMLIKANAAHPVLSDIGVRRALSLALDRDGLASAVLRYPAGADQILPPLLSDWHSEHVQPLRYDPDEARFLLAEAGWVPADDGILVRDGQRLSLTLTSYPDRPEMPLSAAVIQQMFAEIGVELTIDLTNSSEIPVRHHDGTLELALFARNFALTPSPLGTFLTDYAPNGDWGAMGWDNPEFVDLVRDLARGRGGQSERDRAIEILQTELPVLPVAWYQQTAVISHAITGAVLDPFERTIGLKYIRWAE